MPDDHTWKLTSRKALAAAWIWTLLAVLPGTVMAQGARGDARSSYSNRLRRPSVSPYLNLYRNDSSALPNYQTLVRPQLQQQSVNQSQQTDISRLQQQLAAKGSSRQTSLPQTGHPTRFRYFSHFYGPTRATPHQK